MKRFRPHKVYIFLIRITSQVDLAGSTRLVILIKNIYTLWGWKSFLLPVTYFPTSLVFPFTLRITGIRSYISYARSLWISKATCLSYVVGKVYLSTNVYKLWWNVFYLDSLEFLYFLKIISVKTLNCKVLDIPQFWTTLSFVCACRNAILGSYIHLNCYKLFHVRNSNSMSSGKVDNLFIVDIYA